VAAGDDRVLIDAGLSYRALRQRLDGVGVDPDTLGAVLITHAHVDHVRGAAMLSRKHGIPIHATGGAREGWGRGADKVAGWEALLAGRPVAFGALRFIPFGVSHDADEALGFRIETPDGAIGFATDVGQITDDLVARFSDCRVLVVESNHAVELLRVSPYAPSVRMRIGGDGGHLSNEALAGFIREHLGAQVRCIVLAHLSRTNNVPALAELICREALTAAGRPGVRVVVAGQDQPTPTIDLAGLAPAPVSPVQAAQQVSLPFGGASARA